MDEFAIQINDIIFTLLSKSLADNLVYEVTNEELMDCYRKRKSYDGSNRKFIQNCRDKVQFTSINSNGEEKILYAYRSTSELGVWRLGYLRMDDCGLNKFSPLDYVQGTLLHHSLQALINEKIDKLPFIRETDMKLVMDHKINIKFFEENSFDENEHKFISTNFPSDAEKNDIIESRTLTLSPFSDLTVTCDKIFDEQQIRRELDKISITLSGMYEIVNDSNTYITSHNFDEPNENISNSIMKMYSVNLKNIENDENSVVLIYGNYKLDYGKSKTTVSGCYGIALLPMDKISVNEYGIYKNFIQAGIYICKPISYSVQCKFNPLELSKRQCSKTYSYVGDRYENVFPYKELNELLNMSETTLQELEVETENAQNLGGKSKRSKSKRSKSKRSKSKRSKRSKSKRSKRSKSKRKRSVYYK
jgi:hypothetical protein